MDTILIGQGYNLQDDSSMGKELIAQFNSHRYDSFTCLVAFASYGGISALTPYIQDGISRGMEIKIILGIDQQGTSKEALEEVLSWGVDTMVYHTDSSNIFHPKIYLFENIDIFTLIVGSNNLTEMGLVKNIECSLLVKDIKSNPIHNHFYEYWKRILNGTDLNLYPISQDFIQQLYEDGLITSEAERATRYDNGKDSSGSGRKKNIEFRSEDLQKHPDGFSPKRIVKAVKSINTSNEKEDTDVRTASEVSFAIDKNVLIAEIGKGDRWKQVNFPIEIFENFFGAKRGEKSYTIELMNIANNGALGEIEERQAVTVKSKNYRFEILCDETAMAYPTGSDRPIGIFVKIGDRSFIYQVLMPGYPYYSEIRKYLYLESKTRRADELRRHIAHVEAIHAIYPDFII